MLHSECIHKKSIIEYSYCTEGQQVMAIPPNRNSFDKPKVSITNSSDSPFNFWYVYTTATKDIKGNKSANILGAIKLTNQK